MKVFRVINVVRVERSRIPQLHMLRAGKKGCKANSAMRWYWLCVTGHPLVSLTALKLWLCSVCKNSYQAEKVVCTDLAALHTTTSSISDTVISQFPFEDCFLAQLHAGPSGLSFIDWMLSLTSFKLEPHLASMMIMQLLPLSAPEIMRQWVSYREPLPDPRTVGAWKCRVTAGGWRLGQPTWAGWPSRWKSGGLEEGESRSCLVACAFALPPACFSGHSATSPVSLSAALSPPVG